MISRGKQKASVPSPRVMAIALAMKESPAYDTGPAPSEEGDGYQPDDAQRLQNYSLEIPTLFLPEGITEEQLNTSLLYVEELKAATIVAASELIAKDARKNLPTSVICVDTMMPISSNFCLRSSLYWNGENGAHFSPHSNVVLTGPLPMWARGGDTQTSIEYANAGLEAALSKLCSE